MNLFSSILVNLKIIFYSIFTALILIFIFSTVIFLFQFIFITNFTLNLMNLNFWLILLSPLLFTGLYTFCWMIFVFIHSKIIVPVFLGSLKTGKYSLNDAKTKLLAVRLSADQTARMMLIPLDFMPLIVNRYLRPHFLRSYGAKIGENSYISRDSKIDACSLIRLGKNIVVGQLSVVSCHYIAKNELVLNDVTIGDNVTIGDYSLILPGSVIENDVILGMKSIIPKKHILHDSIIQQI